MNDAIDIRSTVPAPIADDDIMAIAQMAEQRVAAIIKIKQVALSVTNAHDWTDQQDRPYLQASGSEKVANLFDISWGFATPEPIYEEEPDGHYTYTFRGWFRMGTRTIEVEGSRSSKDPFFTQNKYEEIPGSEKKKKIELAVRERNNKRDVRMAAYTNFLGNGISRILGIRNLTWEDLEAFAKVKKEDVRGIQYKKAGEKPPIKEPQKKANGDAATTPGTITTITEIYSKSGEKNGKPYTKYTIETPDGKFNTFSETSYKVALDAKNSGAAVAITFKTSQYGNDLESIGLVPREPGDDTAAESKPE